jgi:hypothetical protein
VVIQAQYLGATTPSYRHPGVSESAGSQGTGNFLSIKPGFSEGKFEDSPDFLRLVSGNNGTKFNRNLD